MEVQKEDCQAHFEKKFGTPSIVLSAPGRANIIGEHTDYNQGWVLPFTIDKYIHFVAARSEQGFSTIVALNLKEEVVLKEETELTGFAKFLKACITKLEEKYPNDYKVNLVFGGDLPIGAGISSSSALCCGFLATLSKLYQLNLSTAEILKFSIAAERGVAVEGGIMDQFTIIHGKANQAILLDCLDNSVEYISCGFRDYVFCIFDSRVAHNLAETAYEDRVNTCRSALKKVKEFDVKVKNFRSLKQSHLELLQGKEKNRIEHVLRENERVLQAVEYLKKQDATALGLLLNQSHESLRDLYEVSCSELDFIVRQLKGKAGVAGARMMGGGFGGSVIGLVKNDSVEKIGSSLQADYFKQFGIQLRFFVVKPSDGLGINL